ncbi:hypothetical protein GCM10022205_21770 [Spinactinospora alkalitolerans]
MPTRKSTTSGAHPNGAASRALIPALGGAPHLGRSVADRFRRFTPVIRSSPSFRGEAPSGRPCIYFGTRYIRAPNLSCDVGHRQESAEGEGVRGCAADGRRTGSPRRIYFGTLIKWTGRAPVPVPGR